MAKFGDLKTPIEIRNHLLDVIDRTLKNDKNACLYHYTDFTSIFNIVCSGYIWLGSTQKMNDLLEGDFIESMDGSHRVYSICFSRAEENLAMYKMYAPKPDGAMLVFPMALAQPMIDELPNSKESNKLVNIVKDKQVTADTTPVALHWSAVAYKDLHSDTLRLNGIKNEAIETPLDKKELSGFVKLHGWEYEKEVRLAAYAFNELADDEKVAVKLPEGFTKHIQIVTGPSFDKKLHLSEVAKLKRMNVKIHESEYDALVDLGKSLPEEAADRIAKLEEENKELKAKIQTIAEGASKYYSVSSDSDYQKKYKELRDEAVYVLSYYANVYMQIVEESDESHEETSKALRDIGVKFEVLATNESSKGVGVPDTACLKEVSRLFIGLSNNMWIYPGGDAGRKLDKNIEWAERIKSILGIS